MSLRDKALKGLSWLVFQNLGVRLVSFVVLLILARLLEPAAFGLVALATMAIQFMQTFVAGGFASAIIQRDQIETAHLDTAFWTNLVVSLLAMAVLWFGAAPLARVFAQPELEEVMLWLSPLLLFRGLNQVQIAILRRNLEFRSLAVRELVADPIGGAVGVVMAFSGFGVWSLVGRELVTSIARLIILWTSTRWRPGLSVSGRHFVELFRFGVSVLGHNLVGFFNKRSAGLLIGYFLGASALGYFTVASRIFRMVTQALAGTLGSVAWPVFSRLQAEPERLRNAFLFATGTSCLVLWPSFVALSVMAPELVPLVFGKQWLPSIPVMQILAFMVLLALIETLNDSVIMALGKPHWRLYLHMAVTVIGVLGLLVVVEQGIVAVALWHVIASYLFLPASLWMINRLIAVNPWAYFRTHLVPFVGSLAMAAVIAAVRESVSGVLGLAGQTAVMALGGAATYIITVRLLAPKEFGELVRLFLELVPVRRTVKGKS